MACTSGKEAGGTGRCARVATARGCAPLRGSDLLSTFELDARDRWASLGYAALTFPVLCFFFYLGVRNVRHEHR